MCLLMKLDGYDLFIYYYYFLISNKDVYSKNYLMQKGIRQIKDYRKRIKKKKKKKILTNKRVSRLVITIKF